jgi:hypothetical protein
VVAATGTGKTVLAAFDVARLHADFPEQFPSPEPPPLLLIAHRKEILLQALATFRQVLRDPSFGELYVDGEMPSQWRHVFASVQSLANRSLAEIPAERFKVVIVDEFHHAAASSYRRWLDHLRPQLLLGLTATPERADGLDILHWFGGRIATELRLWSALDQGLLAPFHYFAVADATDLSALEWRRGGYVASQLSAVYTGDHRRVDLILSELHNTVADPARMRALGFCVSVEHARSPGRPAPPALRRAADPLRRRPLQRRARHPRDRHRAALAAHRERRGVPAAARPGSAALARHRQELPHGARPKNATSIGQQHRRFRFDLRYRALLGCSRRQLEDQLAQGFPFLPPGCRLVLDRVSSERVLANLRQCLPSRRPQLLQELRALAAGLLHLDDPDRLRATAASLAASAPPDPEALSERERRQWLMLTAQLFGTGRQWRPLDQALEVLWQAGAWRQELIQLLLLLAERADRRLHPLPWALPVPLRVHGHYTRAEIEAAFGVLSTESPWIHREGVLWHQASATDLLFITLRKSEALFSPSTRYRDLALGPSLFHWESQSNIRAASSTGQRYIHHASRGSRVLLFVREHRKQDGRPGAPTEPFVCMGFASYESHEGERPMAIRWRLEREIPAAWLPVMALAV